MKLENSLDQLERHLNRIWRDHDTSGQFNQVSFNEYDYLKTIQQLGSPRMSDIARNMHVQKPSVSNMLAKLERKALVQRHRCAEDGRAFRITLTEKGLALMTLDEKILAVAVNRIKKTLSATEYRSLEKLLTKVCNGL